MLKIIILASALLVSTSCAKLSYLIEQGVGQLKLQNKARDNKLVIEDPRVPKDFKEKIKKIELYKDYFYQYFKRKQTKIYSKTTLLDQEAVTYLVIASPYNEIKPHEECFIFAGCFPYLGFFKESSAKKYQEKLEKKDFVTYRRPVYAYSTLGHLNDPILSSFFNYDEFGLTEVIFHELFHTIFFVKDDVDLNENLANYFGKELAMEYYQYDEADQKKLEKELKTSEKISILIVKKVKELQALYKKEKDQSKERMTKIFENFMSSSFQPAIEEKCVLLKVQNCYPLKREWNNASFAAFLTYEKSKNKVAELHQKTKLSLKDFYNYIQNKYDEWDRKSTDLKFSEYLLGISHETPLTH